MSHCPRPELPAEPGEQVRWRHPRLAIARGWLQAYGPGPFEVVALMTALNPPAYLVRTERGEHIVNVQWLGPAGTI